jgi:hypothetical protein
MEMTIPVQRTAELNRMQTGENARPDETHQQFADRINRESQQLDHHVSQTYRSEQNEVDADGKGSGGYRGRRGKKRKHEQGREHAAPASESIFDVKV